MALRFEEGAKFAGYKVARIHLTDDGIERYEVRPEDGLARSLLCCPAREEQDSRPRDVPLEAIAARLASIDDPALPKLIEARQTDRFPWVLIESPRKARRLSTALQESRFESVADAFGLIDAIAALLERARERGFVHGRLQPGSIWIDDRNRLVKVYDLGFTEIFGPMPLSCPQRYCLAPEQIKGAPASERSDIYTLGVILYELLAGHPIFMTEKQAPGREKMIELILTREPAPIASIRPLPTYIDDFVFRAMAKREHDRFASWAAFRSALQAVAARYLREEPSSSPVTAPDSSEPSDPDRVQRDTLESAAVVPRPPLPSAELPVAPELPAPTPDEVPAPLLPRIPANDQERPTREWRQRRKKKELIAAIPVVALVTIVVLSLAAIWRDTPKSVRADAPSPTLQCLPGAPSVAEVPPAPPPGNPMAQASAPVVAASPPAEARPRTVAKVSYGERRPSAPSSPSPSVPDDVKELRQLYKPARPLEADK